MATKQHRGRRGLGCWAYVSRPGAVRVLPPFTDLVLTDDGWQVQPDTDALWDAVSAGDVPYLDDCGDGFRGLAVDVSDHGNVELLRVFRNGNTRSIWGMV